MPDLATTRRWRPRFSLRTLAVLDPLLAYVRSYFRLSRRGMREGAPFEAEGFVYVSATDLWDADGRFVDQGWQRHLERLKFYAPVTYFDQNLLAVPIRFGE